MPNQKWPHTSPAKPRILSSLQIEGTGSKVLARDLRAFVNNPRIPDTAEITLEVHHAVDQRDSSSWKAIAGWDETDEPTHPEPCEAVAPRDANIRWGMIPYSHCELELGHSVLRNGAGHAWPKDPTWENRFPKPRTGNSMTSQREETGG